MRLKTLVTMACLAMITTPSLAQSPSAVTTAKAAATVGAPLALGAALPATSTFAWTTLTYPTQTWTFPFSNSRFFLSPLGPNGGITQGVHATGQYVSNVLNPHYFNEKLILDPNIVSTPGSGAHQTTAQYEQTNHHSRRSSNPSGKIAVGCIAGSAISLIATSVIKAHRMGSPLRWRSQAEHERIVASGVERQYELTSEQAQTAAALCGLGGFVALR